MQDLGLIDVLHPDTLSARALTEWLCARTGSTSCQRSRIDFWRLPAYRACWQNCFPKFQSAPRREPFRPAPLDTLKGVCSHMTEPSRPKTRTMLLYAQDNRGMGHINRTLTIVRHVLAAHPDSCLRCHEVAHPDLFACGAVRLHQVAPAG